MCWFGSIEVAILGMIDGGGRLNAGLFFALAVLGFISTFVRTEIVVWVSYAANAPALRDGLFTSLFELLKPPRP